jgi:hypothetical protein
MLHKNTNNSASAASQREQMQTRNVSVQYIRNECVSVPCIVPLLPFIIVEYCPGKMLNGFFQLN